MASTNEITTAAGYSGNAALGGAVDAPVIIDPTAVQRFATFQFYSDKDKWDQKQKDDVNAAKQISDIASYDIASPLTPYSDALKGKLQEIQDYTKNNPDALTYSNSPEKYQELYKKINEFGNLRKAATASDAVYNANKNKIDTEADLPTKQYMQADLDTRVKELFTGGVSQAQNKILASASPLNPDDYTVPTPKVTEYDAISQLPNSDVVNKFKFVNPDQLLADTELEFSKAQTLDENAPSFKALSPERQALERQKFALAGTKRKAVTDMADNLNGLLNEYKAAHPDVDITKVSGDPTGKDTLLDIIKSANKYNAQIDQLNSLIAGGKAKDPTGKVITHQFSPINLADGISPAELGMMNALQKTGTPIWSLVKDIKENDNSIQLQGQANQRRINAANIAKDEYIANLPYEKQKAGALDAAGKQIDFGNLIYGINTPPKKPVDIIKTDGNKINGVTINNGVVIDKSGNPVDYTGDVRIPADNLDNSIVTEFNKYAGSTKVGTNGEASTTVPTSQLKPDDNGKFTIRMENGQIKGILASDGTFATADQFQHITLEAGQKGATKYKKPDPNYGKFDVPKAASLKDSYDFNGKSISLDKIKKAASQSGLSVEDYIKKANLQ